MAGGSGFGPGDVMYCAMPMFHGNALNTCVVPAIAAGAELVLRRRFSASGFLPDVRRYGVTYFNYVGRALAYVLATPPRARRRRQHACASASAPTPRRRTSRRSSAASPAPSSRATGRARGRSRCRGCPGTPRQAMGKPPPGTDVVIVDPVTGIECPPARFDAEGKLRNASEAIGEIVSRDGVARFEGYYANDEADAERTRDGWFWSGDLGYRDDDGLLLLRRAHGGLAAGRRGELRRRARGADPRPLPGRRHRGGAPRARPPHRRPGRWRRSSWPTPTPSTPPPSGTSSSDQSDLGTKWAPRFVRITDRIPLTGTGKVDKRPLRRQHWTTTDPVWWRPFASRGGGPPSAYRRLTADDVDALDARVRRARPPAPCSSCEADARWTCNGRTVLVTGANTGIGRATATELARRGARVHVACRSAERARPVLDDITTAHGPDAASFLALDLADLASVRAAAPTLHRHGRAAARPDRQRRAGGPAGPHHRRLRAGLRGQPPGPLPLHHDAPRHARAAVPRRGWWWWRATRTTRPRVSTSTRCAGAPPASPALPSTACPSCATSCSPRSSPAGRTGRRSTTYALASRGDRVGHLAASPLAPRAAGQALHEVHRGGQRARRCTAPPIPRCRGVRAATTTTAPSAPRRSGPPPSSVRSCGSGAWPGPGPDRLLASAMRGLQSGTEKRSEKEDGHGTHGQGQGPGDPAGRQGPAGGPGGTGQAGRHPGQAQGRRPAARAGGHHLHPAHGARRCRRRRPGRPRSSASSRPSRPSTGRAGDLGQRRGGRDDRRRRPRRHHPDATDPHAPRPADPAPAPPAASAGPIPRPSTARAKAEAGRWVGTSPPIPSSRRSSTGSTPSSARRSSRSTCCGATAPSIRSTTSCARSSTR